MKLSGTIAQKIKQADWFIVGFCSLVASSFFPEYVSSYTLSLLCMIALKNLYATGFRWPKHLWIYSLLLLFCWQLLGMTYSNDPKNGLSLLGMSLLMAIFPFLLHAQQKSPEEIYRLVYAALKWLWVSSVLASIYVTALGIAKVISIGQDYWLHLGYNLYYTGLSEHLMHPSYFSCLVMMAFMGGVYLRWKGQLASSGIFYGVQAWLLLFMFMLSARMTIIAFILSSMLLLLYLARTQPERKKMYRLVWLMPVVVFVLFLALPSTVKERYTSLFSLKYDIGAQEQEDFNGLTIRFAEWRGVGEAMHGHWLVGHGTGSGKQALLDAYERIGFRLGIELGYNAHNQLLETALQNGLLGSVLLLLSFIMAFRHAWQNNNWLGMWLLLFIFLSMQTESLLIRNRGALFFAMYVGLLLLLPREDLPGKKA